MALASAASSAPRTSCAVAAAPASSSVHESSCEIVASRSSPFASTTLRSAASSHDGNMSASSRRKLSAGTACARSARAFAGGAKWNWRDALST